MANRLNLAFDIDQPAAPLERSINSGSTWTALPVPTTGTHKTALLTGIPAAAYGVGVIQVRPVGYPAQMVGNTTAITVAAPVGFDLYPTGDSRRTQGDNTAGNYSVPYQLAVSYASNTAVAVTTTGIAHSGYGLTVSYGTGNPSLLSLYATEVRPLIQASIAAGRTAIVEVEAGINDMAFLVEQGTLTNAQITAQLRQGRIDYHAGAQADGARTIATTPFAAAPRGTNWTQAMYDRLEAIRLDDVAWTRTNAQGILHAIAIADVASDYQVDAQSKVILSATNNRTADGVHLAADGRIAIDAPVVKAAFDIAMTNVFGIAPGRTAPVAPTAPVQQAWLHSEPVAASLRFAGSGGADSANFCYVHSSIISGNSYTGTTFSVGYGAYPDAFALYDVYCNGVLVGSINDSRTASGGIVELTKTFAMAAGTKTGWEIRPVTTSGGPALDSGPNPPILYFYRASAA